MLFESMFMMKGLYQLKKKKNLKSIRMIHQALQFLTIMFSFIVKEIQRTGKDLAFDCIGWTSKNTLH